VSDESQTPLWIELDGAVNVRAVAPRMLLRADNLQSLSARDVRRLVDEHGVEVVVDLRTDVEVKLEGAGPMCAEPGVRIELRSLHPDSAGNIDLDPSTVKPWESHHDDESLEEPPVVRVYMSYLRRRPDSIVATVRTIARARGAVLVHCAAGKDRTGVVVALALDAAGVDRAKILADYLASAQRIDAIFARLLSSPLYRAELEGLDPGRHAPVARSMERVLELVDERHGGSAAWLSAHGLEDDDLQQLRQRLLPATANRNSAEGTPRR
jgi:protein-tyrosine phosphatase